MYSSGFWRGGTWGTCPWREDKGAQSGFYSHSQKQKLDRFNPIESKNQLLRGISVNTLDCLTKIGKKITLRVKGFKLGLVHWTKHIHRPTIWIQNIVKEAKLFKIPLVPRRPGVDFIMVESFFYQDSSFHLRPTPMPNCYATKSFSKVGLYAVRTT